MLCCERQKHYTLNYKTITRTISTILHKKSAVPTRTQGKREELLLADLGQAGSIEGR